MKKFSKFLEIFIAWIFTPILAGIISYALVPQWWVVLISVVFALVLAKFATSIGYFALNGEKH